MHPYQLQSIIRITHKDDFLGLSPGSMYKAIERLLQAGLVEVAETTRSGRRPERTVYRITPEGNREAIGWLRELLEKPAADMTWFFAALSFLPALHARDARDQLRKRASHLEAEIRQHKYILKTVTKRVGRLSLIELEYSVALRTAELRWVKRIIKELMTDKLNWNPEMLRKHASNFFQTCLPPQLER